MAQKRIKGFLGIKMPRDVKSNVLNVSKAHILTLHRVEGTN